MLFFTDQCQTLDGGKIEKYWRYCHIVMRRRVFLFFLFYYISSHLDATARFFLFVLEISSDPDSTARFLCFFLFFLKYAFVYFFFCLF